MKSKQITIPKSYQTIFFEKKNLFVGCTKSLELWAFDGQKNEVKNSSFKVFFTQIADSNYESLHSNKILKRYRESLLFRETSHCLFYLEEFDFEDFGKISPSMEQAGTFYHRFEIQDIEIQIQDFLGYYNKSQDTNRLVVISLRGYLSLFDLDSKKLLASSLVSESVSNFNHTLIISNVESSSSDQFLVLSLVGSLPYLQLVECVKSKTGYLVNIRDRYTFKFDGMKYGYDSCFNKISSDVVIDGFPVISLIQSRTIKKKIFIFTVIDGKLVLILRDQMPSYFFNDFRSDKKSSLIMIDQYLTAIRINFLKG